MAGADTVSERLGLVYVPAEELADIPGVPRRAFIGRDDVNSAVTGVAALLAYVGAIALHGCLPLCHHDRACERKEPDAELTPFGLVELAGGASRNRRIR